jgi:NAD(P)-dependent dehydrogenase (short-subunit alcohol dehydrogenase family)
MLQDSTIGIVKVIPPPEWVESLKPCYDEANLAKRVSTTPLRRIGEPDEIAGAAVFLASQAGSFMTGQSLVIDGGVTIS